MVCPFTWALSTLSLSSPVPRSPSHQWAKSHWAAKPMYRTGYRIACPCHHTRSRRYAAFRELRKVPPKEDEKLIGCRIWNRPFQMESRIWPYQYDPIISGMSNSTSIDPDPVKLLQAPLHAAAWHDLSPSNYVSS
jgi:hypothetical protein